jgi:hypothetical protein
MCYAGMSKKKKMKAKRPSQRQGTAHWPLTTHRHPMSPLPHTFRTTDTALTSPHVSRFHNGGFQTVFWALTPCSLTPWSLTPCSLTPWSLTPCSLTPWSLTPWSLTPWSLTPWSLVDVSGKTTQRESLWFLRSPNIIRATKSRDMRWAGHVARTVNTYRVVVNKHEETNSKT